MTGPRLLNERAMVNLGRQVADMAVKAEALERALRFRKLRNLCIWAVLTVALLASAACAGTAPQSDLAAPIPLCEEMAEALDLPEEAFAGLHPDAFAQFRGMVADLCQPPDDARSWAILRAWGEGPDVPPAPVPLPAPLFLLTAALAALWKANRKCQ